MTNDFRRAVSVAALFFSVLAAPAASRADVALPPLLSDGMVLQQKQPIRLWGTASPGEKITLKFAGQTASVTAGSDGNWETQLKPMSAGGPYTLNVTGNNRLTVRDILIGEVWVCSGQSNMEWTLGGLPEAKDEIVHASDTQLRMFTVPKAIGASPKNEITGGRWDDAVPQAVGGFSAVGYYFGKALRQARKVPIGLIHTSWGGTRIEAWMSRATLESTGAPTSDLAPLDPNDPVRKAALAAYQKRVDAWKAAGSPQGQFEDPGVAPLAKGWEAPDLSATDWKPVRVPGNWDDAGPDELKAIDGGVWFRRTFTLPTGMAGKDLTLTLGAIDDYDTTYINGTQVGATGKETPNWWQHPRVYSVPARLLKPGENTIAVRVWDSYLGGGFMGNPNDLRLSAQGDSSTYVPLAGEWTFKVEQTRPSNPGNPPGESDPNMATGLYNAMLYPLRRYPIAGAIWYQGEANAGDPMRYRKLLPAMITNWRQNFGVGAFPFLVVQLAPFMAIQPEPRDSSWAGLREAQWLTTTALPGVGTAIITDSGDEKDIHPHRKEPVGQRLALLARRIAYGEKIDAFSPSFKSMKVEGANAIITFENVGKGLVARPADTAGKPVSEDRVVGFAIAGADGRFVWADARITGPDTVVVSSAQVSAPTAVRFGWADFPVVNLYSRDGLPVVPFRTDRP